MSNYETLLGPAPTGPEWGPGPRPPKKPRSSTFIVGAITALFMLIGALSGGLGGALVFLAISVGLTGLYVLATGRRSWAWLPAKRKAGAIALAVSFALFIGGAVALPRTAAGDLQAASSEGGASPASAQASATAKATPTPSSAPTAQEAGAPLDPDSPYLLGQGVSVTAPKTQPAFATKAIDLLATLPVKGRAPKTGYDRALFGQAWARRRPERLRHPERHAQTRPHGHHLHQQRPLQGAVRNAGGSLHGHQHQLPAGDGHQQRRPDRPRCGPQRRLAEGRAAADHGTADGLRQRSAEPAVDGRPHQHEKGRRRRRHLAAAEQGLPVRIRGPADFGEGDVQPVGYAGGARRDGQDPG